MTNREVFVWLSFFALNFIFFVPGLFIDHRAELLPVAEFFNQDSWIERVKFFFRRNNQDFFRFSIEFCLFSILTFVCRLKSAFWHKSFAGLTIILWLYLIYHQSFFHLFALAPLLYSDWPFLKTGFGIVWAENPIIGTGILVLIPLLIWLLWTAFVRFFRAIGQISFGRISLVLFSGISVALVAAMIQRPLPTTSRDVFQESTLSLAHNLIDSRRAKIKFAKLDQRELEEFDQSFKFDLVNRPNIYMIFIESFGRVAYNDENVRDALVRFEGSLKANKWSLASRFSTAPVSGGSSWVSYGSVMLGYNIENRANFVSIMKDTLYRKNHHFFYHLKGQGYKNFRLIPLPENERDQIPWDQYQHFYGVDEWVKYMDLNVNPEARFGWRGAPADQYSLHYTYHHYLKDRHEPFSLFFITLNSHTPFHAPEALAANWADHEQLNNSNVDFLTNPNEDDYYRSVAYEIDMLSDFIVRNGSDNDLFLLIGDHQPPYFTREEDGYETPVFVISKDIGFVSGLELYGFEQTTLPGDQREEVNHAGLHSILMRSLQSHYGQDSLALPPYYPFGYVFE